MSNSEQWSAYAAGRNSRIHQHWSVSLKRAAGGIGRRMVEVEASCAEVASAVARRLFAGYEVEAVHLLRA